MMFIHEYGSRNNQTTILMAPMMVSGANLYPHCGYMAAETAKYMKQIEEFMKA